MVNNFCNKGVTVEAWYAVCKSGKIPLGHVEKIAIGPTWLAIRRFYSGKLVASDRYCPHMGADLTLSKEIAGEKFKCAFHGLEFDNKGCCATPGMEGCAKYQLETFPAKEKYGLVWVYMGNTPKYEIPELSLKGGFILQLPSKKINSHHHIVIANPLDSVHIGPVHSLEIRDSSLERDRVHIKSKVTGAYRAWWMALLSRVYHEGMHIEFSSHGSSISVADAQWHNTRVVILFTARQDENNKCSTNTAIWMNSYNPFDWARALIVILGILKQDVDILNSIKVKTNFTKADKGMIAFKDVVDSMPIYEPLAR